jgi:hypothetical protein
MSEDRAVTRRQWEEQRLSRPFVQKGLLQQQQQLTQQKIVEQQQQQQRERFRQQQQQQQQHRQERNSNIMRQWNLRNGQLTVPPLDIFDDTVSLNLYVHIIHCTYNTMYNLQVLEQDTVANSADLVQYLAQKISVPNQVEALPEALSAPNLMRRSRCRTRWRHKTQK